MSLIESIGIVLAMPISFISGPLRQIARPETNLYIAEDGSNYVTEDGLTFYAQEI